MFLSLKTRRYIALYEKNSIFVMSCQKPKPNMDFVVVESGDRVLPTF